MYPRIRVVTLNYDGGAMTLDCLRSVLQSTWPAECLDVILVDNASIDGIADRVRREFPAVTVVDSFANLGFSGGCNLGIRAAGRWNHQWDFVALINNDATVAPDWLEHLVGPFEQASRVGATSPKMLFADRFRGVELHAPVETVHGKYRTKQFGVRVTGVEVAGERFGDHDLTFTRQFSPPSHQDQYDDLSRWSAAPTAEVHRRADPSDDAAVTLRIRLSALRPVTVTARTPSAYRELRVGTDPEWFHIDGALRPYDVVQNAGSALFASGFGGDRGFLHRDGAEFAEPAEVFAWCGGAVLLSRAYLDDVGLFDDTLFLYYEDTDLSWRGRLKGWTYHYVPNAVVRHRHAASTGQGSALFRYQVDRNRLLTLMKNAPLPLLADGLRFEVRQTAADAVFHVAYPLKQRRRPSFGSFMHRGSVGVGVAKRLPGAWTARRATTEAQRRAVAAAWIGRER